MEWTIGTDHQRLQIKKRVITSLTERVIFRLNVFIIKGSQTIGLLHNYLCKNEKKTVYVVKSHNMDSLGGPVRNSRGHIITLF